MTINLIPPKLRKEKELMKTVNLVFLFASFLLIILIGAAALVYGADYQKKTQLRGVQKSLDDQVVTLKKYEDIEKEIESLNSKLKTIDSLSSKKIIWSSILDEIAKDTPVAMQIKTLSLDKETGKISITGFADTRRDIAKLKEKMDNSKYFKNVVFASSNYSEETKNYSFSISCELGDIKK